MLLFCKSVFNIKVKTQTISKSLSNRKVVSINISTKYKTDSKEKIFPPKVVTKRTVKSITEH